MSEPDATRIAHVVRRLVGLPQETESTEFKRNYQDPNGIGEYMRLPVPPDHERQMEAAFGVENDVRCCRAGDFLLARHLLAAMSDLPWQPGKSGMRATKYVLPSS